MNSKQHGNVFQTKKSHENNASNTLPFKHSHPYVNKALFEERKLNNTGEVEMGMERIKFVNVASWHYYFS